MGCLIKERQWVVIGPALNILRQTEKRRAAIGRVEHRRDGRWQGLNNLRGMGDAIPIAADSLERIIEPSAGLP
jgi:hypothetical protein